jgi:hypothetical protein
MGTSGVRAEVLNWSVAPHRGPVGIPFPARRGLPPIRSTQLHSLCWLRWREVEVLIVIVICPMFIRVNIARNACKCPTSDTV